MRRGDLVTIVLPGAYGKPRPAMIIQSDFFRDHPSVTILPVTSELRHLPLFRIAVQPDSNNGLSKISEIMIDKMQAVPREKIGCVFGHLSDETMLTVNRALAVFIGIA
jgi:mRNA interferase MazF